MKYSVKLTINGVTEEDANKNITLSVGTGYPSNLVTKNSLVKFLVETPQLLEEEAQPKSPATARV